MTALVVLLRRAAERDSTHERRIDGTMAAVFFIANVILLAIIMIVSRMLPRRPGHQPADRGPQLGSPHAAAGAVRDARRLTRAY